MRGSSTISPGTWNEWPEGEKVGEYVIQLSDLAIARKAEVCSEGNLRAVPIATLENAIAQLQTTLKFIDAVPLSALSSNPVKQANWLSDRASIFEGLFDDDSGDTIGGGEHTVHANKALSALALLVSVTLYGYEDKTHQALTRQAVEIAKRQGIGQALADQEPDHRRCWKARERERITRGMTSGGVAHVMLKSSMFGVNSQLTSRRVFWGPNRPGFGSSTFWNDAIDLWRKGKRQDAAFILGRALHLVADMAAPQHAMDEMHYPGGRWWLSWLRHPSFLENFTEAHLKGSAGDGLCADSTRTTTP